MLFNWFGYRVITGYLKDAAANRLHNRIRHNTYDSSDLFEVRLPMRLAYYAGTRTFALPENEAVIGGTQYHYVKYRIEKGELILLCLRDNEGTRIENARNEFFRLANDLMKSSGNHSPNPHNNGNLLHSFPGVFYESPDNWALQCLANRTRLHYLATHTRSHKNWLADTPAQPPETAAISC